MNHQKGSAHAIIVIGLVILLAGALGFIFWQNFLQKDDAEGEEVAVSKKQEAPAPKDTVAKVTNQVFTSDEMTFEYPATGWKVKKSDFGSESARIETENYTPSIGMGLDAGADLIVTPSDQKEVPQGLNAKNVEEIEVDGSKGYKYLLEYEGYRLQAFFTRANGSGYAVTMQTAASPTSVEQAAFDLVIDTLNIK